MKTDLIKSFLTRRDFLLLALLPIVFLHPLFSAEAKWIQIGMLHNFYQAHGSEPEEDYGREQQWGFRWPAFYGHQDMQAARGFWIAVTDFDDPLAGKTFPYKVAHVGPRPRSSIEENEFMPVEFYMVGRFAHPEVYVDGELASDLDDNDQVDEYDPDLPADRMIVNTVHSSVGITMHRKIYGYGQQYHDNFFIADHTFTNTGICSKDSSITHNDILRGVYFHWQYRNAVAGEGTTQGTDKINSWTGYMGWGMPNDSRWGINTMNDVLGENPLGPDTDPLYPNTTITVDEYDYDGNIMRCFYSWHGRHSDLSYDNIGSPNYQGYSPDGRLGASQFTGVVTMWADKSTNDRSDDIYQPMSSWYIESNDQVTTNNDQFSAGRMEDEYLRIVSSGHPEKSHAEEFGDGFPNQGRGLGGESQGIGFGPYTLAPGQSIHIVLGEAAGGLSRKRNVEIGGNWIKAMNGESVNMVLPDGSPTSDHNEYKDTWVYTGKDSLMETFRRITKVYKDSLSLGDQLPPEPPNFFEVTSKAGGILLTWSDNAEASPNFEGYKIYRALGEADSNYYEIFDCNLTNGDLVHEYWDVTAVRGQNYYYYIVSHDNGATNTIQPGVPLRSSLFYTKTNKAASPEKQPALTLDNIRIVPNPYNARSPEQYVGSPNRIMFLNMPAYYKMQIFTERGDLIYSTPEVQGDIEWNMLTSSRQIVVSGVYIATFEITQDIYDPSGQLSLKKGDSTFRKFVIIK